MTGATLARHQHRLNAAMPLVLFTDDSGRDWLRAARKLPPGSIAVVRARKARDREARAEALLGVAQLRILVADDPALAERLGAAGLHLPETRIGEALHWRVRHPDWIITAAAHGARAFLHAGGLDAIFLSPVFSTASHPGAPALGPLRAAIIAAASPVPVYALGGITARNAARLVRGFDGIAAITALC